MPFRDLINKRRLRASDFTITLNTLFEKGGPTRQSGNAGYTQDCHRMLQEDVALVTVRMASSVYTLSKRSARVTFTDKVCDI